MSGEGTNGPGVNGPGVNGPGVNGPRLVASIPEVVFADGSRAAVEVVLDSEPAPDTDVFAALVMIEDAEGSFALVYSPRRAEWASPGGYREPGERVRETVVREVLEETGLLLDEAALLPCGYERFRPLTPGRWPREGGCLQVFRTRVPTVRPPLAAAEDDVVDHRWVGLEQFESLCGEAFWWPLAAALLRPPGATARGRG
jgi:8-oxo-dGTP pyrophosphatase MutT (NUDIX family)